MSKREKEYTLILNKISHCRANKIKTLKLSKNEFNELDKSILKTGKYQDRVLTEKGIDNIALGGLVVIHE